jgi:hypothetical protein
LSFIRGRPGGPASFFPPVFHHEAQVNESIDDLTVEYEENGQILVKQIDKEILSKGGWTTIIFRFQEFQPETGDYGPDRYVIQRYQKRGGEYKRQSKFKISSADQARKIIDALGRWVAETGQEQSCK